jgi:hypothetical protein
MMQNGSLGGALKGQPTNQGRPSPSLQWHQRIRLAAACADALSYLHSHVPQVVPCATFHQADPHVFAGTSFFANTKAFLLANA